jgi:integrase/recombinase XerD
MSTSLIDTHLAFLRASGMSSKTVEDRETVLNRLNRELPDGLAAAGTDDLVIWLGQANWSANTRRTYWEHAAGFCQWYAIRSGGPNPMAGLQRPKVHRGLPRPVTDEQLRHALDHAVQPWRTAVILAAWGGMRAGEIARAARADVTEDRTVIAGKGGRSRMVPTHPDVWLEVRDFPNGPLILWRDEPVTPHWLSRSCSQYLTQIGLSDVTLHRFRHWFGTRVQASYRDLRVTQELLGHASPDTTAGYAEVTDGQRRLAVNTLPTLRGHLPMAA